MFGAFSKNYFMKNAGGAFCPDYHKSAPPAVHGSTILGCETRPKNEYFLIKNIESGCIRCDIKVYNNSVRMRKAGGACLAGFSCAPACSYAIHLRM